MCVYLFRCALSYIFGCFFDYVITKNSVLICCFSCNGIMLLFLDFADGHDERARTWPNKMLRDNCKRYSVDGTCGVALASPGVFSFVNLKEHNRAKEDNFGGDDDIRLIGSPVVHTKIDVTRTMLEEVLSDNPELYKVGWEPDHYAREDLVIQVYRQARIRTCTSLTLD